MNVARELDVLKRMAADLPDYLLAETLFWPMQAPSTYPRLSLGLLLLTQARLDALEASLAPAQRAERDSLGRQAEVTLSKWQVAAEKKAERELRARLNLWQRFWEDCADSPQSCAENYPQEVTQRVVVELLLRRYPRLADSPEARPLQAADRLARLRLRRPGFVWSPNLQAAFPESPFWYLHRRP
jgi:hypothetical protein